MGDDPDKLMDEAVRTEVVKDAITAVLDDTVSVSVPTVRPPAVTEIKTGPADTPRTTRVVVFTVATLDALLVRPLAM
jgi:hypothetical protein